MQHNKICCSFGTECNNNCIYCTNTEKDRSPPIRLNEIPKLLEKINTTKDAKVEISGGEPTMRPELFYFLEQLGENCNNVPCTILTNGRNFSKTYLAAKIAEFKVSQLLVPVHADTARIHDAITQSAGSFGETMLGIENLYEYSQPVTLKSVINKMNYERLPQMVELLSRKFPASKGLILYNVEVSGKALEKKDIIGVRLSDTLPYTLKAVDIGKEYGFKLWVYSIPPCMLIEKYKPFAGVRNRHSMFRKSSDGNINLVSIPHKTFETCNGCRYAANCDGVWDNYFDMYGTEEIKPVH